MTTVALFAPCYVDQLYPRVAIAALEVLERLGVNVVVPDGAVCCGQPPANAGFERSAEPTLNRFVRTFARYDRVIVLSGSCALHVKSHAASVANNGDGASVAAATTEFCTFLHDEIGLQRIAVLGARFRKRVGLHIGCHGLRGLGLAKPSELNVAPYNKVRALLQTVEGISFADLSRPDECCGFGGTFAFSEPAISARMGRDRLADYRDHSTEAIVSTDMSCVMHLSGLAAASNSNMPMLHVAEVLAGRAS